MYEIDDIDEKIIAQLRINSRIPVAILAKRLGLARSTVQTRLDRLEDQNVIAGYGVRFGRAFAATHIRATMLATVSSSATSEVIAHLQKITEVEAVHTISGRFDLIIEVAVRDLARLDSLIDDIEATAGFIDSETMVHLSTRFDRGL